MRTASGSDARRRRGSPHHEGLDLADLRGSRIEASTGVTVNVAITAPSSAYA
jgi:hypothetical protein